MSIERFNGEKVKQGFAVFVGVCLWGTRGLCVLS